MRTRILVISEQFTHGGLETQIAGQARVLSSLGIDLLLATGSSSIDCPQNIFAAMLTDIQMDAQISFNELCLTLEKLNKFIFDERVTMIHAHPFYSAIIGLLAAQQSGLPFVVTIHGPISLSGMFGQLYDFLLKSVVLPAASRVYCVSKETELLCHSMAECRTELLPNAVEIPTLNQSSVAKGAPWLWAGRLDADKSEGLLDLIEKVDRTTVSELHIFGDGPQVEVITSFLKNRPDKAEFVRLMGWHHDLTTIMHAYAGIAGMGRVLLEGAALNRPCLLVGYDGVKGLLDAKKFEMASFWNLSGRGLPTITAEAFRQEVDKLSEDIAPFLLREWITLNRDEKAIWKRYAQEIKHLDPLDDPATQTILDALQYRGAIPEPVWWDGELLQVILGFFSNVSFGDSRLKSMAHQISVARLRSETEAMRNETIMLRGEIIGLKGNLAEYKVQISSLNHALVDREEQIASLNQAVAERVVHIDELTRALAERDSQIANLNQTVVGRDGQITAILNSRSWQLTNPMRLLGDQIKRTRYLLRITPQIIAQKGGIWRTCAATLRVYRHEGLSGVKLRIKIRQPQTGSQSITGATDLSWDEFKQKVLSSRESYKGIFIQEPIIDWNVLLHQRPQHIATAFGRLGYLVIYMTPNMGCDYVEGFRMVARNVWITNRPEVNEIDCVVRSFYSTAYMHTPEVLLNNHRKREILAYEYIDHIDPEISGGGDTEVIKRLVALKDCAFGGGADFIVASAQKLYDEAVSAIGKEKVLLVPNGVDTRHYRNPAHLSTSLPDALTAFRKSYSKIVGYFGAIAPWLWYEVISELVKKRSDLGFVFIGPDYYGGVQKLPNSTNLLYLGPVDYKVLPAYGRQFDVCFIPFKPGEIASTTSPLKLFEYFALEKPVVVTSEMRECVAFPEVFQGDSADSLGIAIDQAISVKDDPAFKSRLAQLADENDWDRRAKDYEVVFGMRFTPGQVQLLIRDSYRKDDDRKTYYDVYKAQEYLYWRPVPQWINRMPCVKSVIDVGAAYGTLLIYTALNKGCHEIHAIDLVGYMSKSLQDRFSIKLHRIDFEREPLEIATTFDLVLFTEVIEHLNFHPLPTLQKLKKLMGPNSRLMLTTPDAEEWGRVTDFYPNLDAIPEYIGQNQAWIDGHVWQYSKDELDELIVRAGFIVEKFDYSPGVAARHLCYQLRIKSSE